MHEVKKWYNEKSDREWTIRQISLVWNVELSDDFLQHIKTHKMWYNFYPSKVYEKKLWVLLKKKWKIDIIKPWLNFLGYAPPGIFQRHKKMWRTKFSFHKQFLFCKNMKIEFRIDKLSMSRLQHIIQLWVLFVSSHPPHKSISRAL